MSDDRAKVTREVTGCRHGVLHRGRDGVVEFEATWAASQDDKFADELASFSTAMGVAADFLRLSTWYHWWKGETFEEVLLVTDEVTVERFDGSETTGLDGGQLASPQPVGEMVAEAEVVITELERKVRSGSQRAAG